MSQITSEVNNIFADAVNAAKNMTSQANNMFNSQQIGYGSRREMNQPQGNVWSGQNMQNPYNVATYGYGYGTNSNQFGMYQNNMMNQDLGYPGISSPSYGKGGF